MLFDSYWEEERSGSGEGGEVVGGEPEGGF